MGTSLEVLAAQRRAEFAMGSTWGWGGAHAGGTGVQTNGSHRSTSHVSMAAHGLLKPFVQHLHRHQQVDDTRRSAPKLHVQCGSSLGAHAWAYLFDVVTMSDLHFLS